MQDSVGNNSDHFFGAPYSVGDVSVPDFQQVMVCMFSCTMGLLPRNQDIGVKTLFHY